jgi:hypothetical protein
MSYHEKKMAVLENAPAYVTPQFMADTETEHLSVSETVTELQNMIVSGLVRLDPSAAPKLTEFDEGTQAVRLRATINGVEVSILVTPHS